MGWTFIAVGVLSFLGSLLLMPSVPFVDSMVRQILLLVGFPLFLITGVAVFQIRDVADRRTKRATKIAKKSLGGKMLSRMDFLPVRRDHIPSRESQLQGSASKDGTKSGSGDAPAAGTAAGDSGEATASTERSAP